MSHLPLDGRAILAYLNELGYRNISAEQLREFMKDLRKLIKYEERLQTNINKDDFYEGLFQRTTASFRAKRDKENALKVATSKPQDKFLKVVATEETEKGRKYATDMSNENIPPSKKAPSTTFKIYSSGTSLTRRDSRQVLKEKNQYENLEDNLVDKKRFERNKKASSLLLQSNEAQSASSTTNTTGISRKLVEDCKEPKWQCFCSSSSRSRSQTTGRNAGTVSSNSGSTTNVPPIRPRSRSNQRHPMGVSTTQSAGVLIPKPRPKCHNNRFSDPVKLYQYYQREWKHFRNQIPGELTRSDVRWQIRQKLLDPN